MPSTDRPIMAMAFTSDPVFLAARRPENSAYFLNTVGQIPFHRRPQCEKDCAHYHFPPRRMMRAWRRGPATCCSTATAPSRGSPSTGPQRAITFEMYDAWRVRRDPADESLRAVIVQGAGGAFAAGTDISQFKSFRTAEVAAHQVRLPEGGGAAGGAADSGHRRGARRRGGRRRRAAAGLRSARLHAAVALWNSHCADGG